jgi:hypothetical protein
LITRDTLFVTKDPDMKKLTLLLFLAFLLPISLLNAQQYTAQEYWKMENDTSYSRLLKKMQSGEVLSVEEQTKLVDYKSRLSIYFDKLSDNEKSVYYKNRAQWSAQPWTVNRPPVAQEEDVYAGERSKYSQYLAWSGTFGFFYGLSIDYLLNIQDNGAAVAIPLVTSGLSTLIPILTIKDKNVTYNSLTLSLHGKAMGGAQGAAFGLLLTGENTGDGKLILGTATLASIGLGRLGYVLGRDKPWTQGRAALYTHYGFLMPLEGLAIDAAFNVQDVRVYAATSLVFGAGGYFIADRVARKNDFTRGDVTAISTLSSINGLLGLSVLADIAGNSESDVNAGYWLIPAAGAIGGTVAGQAWLKNARLTSQQGRNVALATTAGALIGIGIAAIFQPESAAPYYIGGYATAMTSYALLVSKYKKSNIEIMSEKNKLSRWHLNIMPQNLFLNKKIESFANANPGRRVTYLPAFSASLNF